MELESGQSIQRWRGLSSEEKPGRAIDILDGDNETPAFVPTGSVFTELDTGHRYIWRGQWPWERQEQTIDAQFEELSGLMREAVTALKVIQAATAILANSGWDANLPTGLDN